MGVKRDIDSGRIDSLGRPIKVSADSIAAEFNAQSKMEQVEDGEIYPEDSVGFLVDEDNEEWVDMSYGSTIISHNEVIQVGRQESWHFADQFSRCAQEDDLSSKDYAAGGGDEFVNDNWGLVTKFLEEEYGADFTDDGSSDIEVEFTFDKGDLPDDYKSMTPEDMAAYVEEKDTRMQEFGEAELGYEFYEWVKKNNYQDKLNL